MAHVAILFWILLAAFPPLTTAQDVAQFEKRMTEFTLDNGLKFLVLERHDVPIVSFHIHADVGAVDEVKGITGLAHIFEHMAFKGTKTIGTKNYQAEAKAMARMDELFDAIKAERRKAEPNQTHLEQLQKQFEEAQAEAQKHIEPDEYQDVYLQEGGGVNAYVDLDYTCYVAGLPSNKIELWMSLESDRFANPVLREFYKEKDVVMEERRMVQNTPSWRLGEEFQGIAYLSHPYGEDVGGNMSDLQTVTRREAEDFFRKYYCPSNLTIAMVGDVDPQNVRRLAEKYFGGIPSGPKPEPVETTEPPQRGERRVVIEDPAQPIVMIGYHQTSINHPDNAVFGAIAQIMGTGQTSEWDRSLVMGVGRTSRLHKSLVTEKKIAVSASAQNASNKYPGLFTFSAIPAEGHTGQECEQAIYDQIEILKTEPVSPEELKKAKASVRAGLIRDLNSNAVLAMNLAFYDVVTGDWRNLFRELDKIERVTAGDIQRIAKEYFTSTNRSVGIINTTPVKN